MKLTLKASLLYCVLFFIGIDSKASYFESFRSLSSSQSATITDVKTDEKVQDEGHDVISRYTGHFGWWNFMWAFILSLYQMTVGFQVFAFSFQTQKKDFWCARPDDLKDTINVTAWKQMSNQSDYSCEMFYEGNHVKCHSFEFSDEIGHTIVQDFNLVCDRRNFLATIETCILVGSSIAPLFSGWLSDKFGRKLILMLSASIQLVVGTAIAFTTSLPLLMVLRFVIGYASLSVGILNAILVMELSSPKYRTIVGLVNMMVAPVGNIVLALITYYLTDWRYIQLAISVPYVLILMLWYWIPQSPRWLLVMNKYDELIALMERMAKTNNKTLPNDLRVILETTPKESEGETDSDNKINPVKIAFSKKYFITTLSLIILFWTNVGMYLALSSHIVDLGGNGSVNMGIAGAIELVITAVAVVIALKLNLKLILLTAMISSAICCLFIAAVPEGQPLGSRVLGITAKCLIGAGHACISPYAAKMVPTHIRNFVYGLANFSAGISLIIVPYIWLLEEHIHHLPTTIMGIYGLLGALGVILIRNKDKGDDKVK